VAARTHLSTANFCRK